MADNHPKTIVLKCGGCCPKCDESIKRTLTRINGVHIVEVNAETAEVIIRGCVDPNLITEVLARTGKEAAIAEVVPEPEAPPPAPAPAPPAVIEAAAAAAAAGAPPVAVAGQDPRRYRIDLNYNRYPPCYGGAPYGRAPFYGDAMDQMNQLVPFDRMRHVDFTQSNAVRFSFRDPRGGMCYDDCYPMNRPAALPAPGPQGNGGYYPPHGNHGYCPPQYPGCNIDFYGGQGPNGCSFM